MKKEKTIHELSKEFPDKTYRELEIYREKDRQQEAGACIMGEMRKDREEDPTDKIIVIGLLMVSLVLIYSLLMNVY